MLSYLRKVPLHSHFLVLKSFRPTGRVTKGMIIAGNGIRVDIWGATPDRTPPHTPNTTRNTCISPLFAATSRFSSLLYGWGEIAKHTELIQAYQATKAYFVTKPTRHHSCPKGFRSLGLEIWVPQEPHHYATTPSLAGRKKKRSNPKSKSLQNVPRYIPHSFKTIAAARDTKEVNYYFLTGNFSTGHAHKRCFTR